MAITATGRRPISRGVAALVGVLAVGAALAAGQLVATLLSPESSPFLAVGDTVIRLSPQWLTEFAKTTFGTADKAVLLAGMGVVVLLLAAAVGLVARRSLRAGVGLVLALGVLGAL